MPIYSSEQTKMKFVDVLLGGNHDEKKQRIYPCGGNGLNIPFFSSLLTLPIKLTADSMSQVSTRYLVLPIWIRKLFLKLHGSSGSVLCTIT
jgi:hypothetical protein